MSTYGLFIDGAWIGAEARETLPVLDPATGERLRDLPIAGAADLDRALVAAERAFADWSARSAFDRGKLLRAAAELIRSRAPAIAETLSREQGKPLAEARGEVLNGADIVDWFAEEGRRAYGRVIPARQPDVQQQALLEPVGPVAAFSPWNFPVSQALRKVAASLAAGCTIILKGPEEAPGAVCAVVAAFAEAGVPAGALNLVFGRPAEISTHLIPAPQIRKVSFTGSVPVGRSLAALAASHMKPATMELGGHAPVLVFDDVDAQAAARQLAAFKFRNAGQVCISPTRFFVQERSYDRFLDAFAEQARGLRLGPGPDAATQIGPLATEKRREAVAALVDEAVADGARLIAGGQRVGNAGFFYAPTVLADVPAESRIMREEPFGPVALVNRFQDDAEAIAAANRSDYGLAAYAFTASLARASQLSALLRTGMVSINHFGLGPAETPFGGVKDSGIGREGGSEGLQCYLVTKFVSLKMAAA